MKIIILAAGKDNRSNSFCKEKPKCLLQFGAETILERQLRILQEYGIQKKDILIVTGYGHHFIESVTDIFLLYNKEFETTDNSYSLYLALKNCREDVLILDGDLVFSADTLKEILSKKGNFVLGVIGENRYGATGIIYEETNKRLTGIGKHILSNVVYQSIMRISKQNIPAFLQELSKEVNKKTWYTIPLNVILLRIPFYLILSQEKIAGINSYFDYIEAKKQFSIEDFSILVTGASGFLGKKIFYILQQNYQVQGIRGNSNSSDLPAVDLTNNKELTAYFALNRPSVVIHTAGYADPDFCERHRERAYQLNVETVRLLTAVCQKRGIKLIHISTDYIFDGDSENEYEHGSQREPKNYYGYTKKLAEDIVSSYENSLIVRVPILYGYNDENDKKTFPKHIVDELKKGHKVLLDDSQIRYPVLIDEVAIAIEKNLAKTGILHITSAQPVTKYQWAKRIAREFGLNETLVYKNSCCESDNRPMHVKLSVKKEDFLVNDVVQGTKILKKQQNCVFQLIYKNSPTAFIGEQNIGVYRYHLGKSLGNFLPKNVVAELDYVMPVPSSGLYYAMGLAEAIGVPYLQGLIKPDVKTRAFQIKDITLRERTIRAKILPIEGLIKGKNIALVDEAIFTGTTLRVVCDVVKACGAKKIYVCLPTPVCRNKCRQYVQPDREVLSRYVDIDQFQDYFQIDGVYFQDYKRFLESLQGKTFCYDCFETDGKE